MRGNDTNDNGSSKGSGHVSILKKRGPGRPPASGRTVDELTSAKGAIAAPTRVERYLSEEDRDALANRLTDPDHFYVFNPDDFSVAVKNEADHDAKVAGIRFHPQMANEIHMLLQRGNLPIKDEHGLIRLAVFELLLKLYPLERARGVPNYLARLKVINQLALRSKQNREFENTLQIVKAEVEALIERGRPELAARFVVDVMREAKQITEAGWREFYLGEIEREYKGLVRAQSKKVRVRRRE